jgi:hypothetical protein
MWTDSDGVGRIEARITPDALGRFVSAIQGGADAITGGPGSWEWNSPESELNPVLIS